MTAIAPSSPMSCHVGEMTLPMMSAASSNSRPSSSQMPKRRQIALRAPCVAAGADRQREQADDRPRTRRR